MMQSTIAHKYPSFRDGAIKGCKRWLDGKRLDDNAEGLWRIHDKLYDLTDFIDRHPGGSEWLDVTKGVDITEQFETHHISGTAEKILPKFYVREASLSRNYKITFDEDGFYRTVKRRVANKLELLDQSSVTLSHFYCDILLGSTLLLSIIAARDHSYLIATFASFTLMWLAVIAHNFIHQKDNWRMYIINLSLMSFHDWRVFHAMSHHLYPNSFHDMEITQFAPYFTWIPGRQSAAGKYTSWIISPLIYSLIFTGEFYYRVMSIILYNAKFYWDDLLPLALPSSMFLLGKTNIWIAIKMWLFIIFLCSLMYGFLSVNAGHHHTQVFHEGDDLKSLDYGIYQLSATIDRNDVKSSLFLTLTHFGHHTLHHFFPTLDHAVLPQLEETFLSTCLEFEVELREYPWWKLIVGQFQQLGRNKKRSINIDRL